MASKNRKSTWPARERKMAWPVKERKAHMAKDDTPKDLDA